MLSALLPILVVWLPTTTATCTGFQTCTNPAIDILTGLSLIIGTMIFLNIFQYIIRLAQKLKSGVTGK